MGFKFKSWSVPALAVVCALAGCNRKETGADVMAKVNGEAISRAEVQKYYDNQTAGSPEKPSGEQEASLRLTILNQLIDDEIMMQRARKLGLLATDEEVDSKLADMKAPFTKEEFERRLKEKNLTEDDFKRDLRRNITREKVLNKEITSKITITDADVTNYYNQHKAEFNFIEPQYHLAQIVITTAPDSQVQNLRNDKAQNDTDARKKAQMLVNRLESGEDFATLAMNYSEQPGTSGNGGDMGFIPESSIKPDRAAFDAISKLKQGQFSQPIPLYDAPGHLAGYRIVKLIAREPAGQRDLNDPRVQQAIRQELRERREQLLKAAYYEMVRDEAKVENFYAEQLVNSAGK